MTKPEVLEHMQRTGLVPVLRAASSQQALSMADAIAAAGVHVLEVTMTVPDALRVLRTLARDQPQLLVGAGTVLDPETALACMAEGAKFIVSPATCLRTVELCRRHDIAVLPGALTPTEIVTAWQAGADVVKVFPAGAMGGPAYIRSLRGPLPHIRLVPTGGITVANAMEYLRAGVFALGVGTDLADPAAIEQGQPERITRTAQAYLDSIARWREQLA